MSEILEQIREAQETIEGERDNLIEAIATLCAAGQMTVAPRSDNLIHKPLILLPQRMYDRMLEKYGKDKTDE